MFECACEGENSTLDVISNCSGPCILNQGLFLKLELKKSFSLSSQRIPGFLCPASKCQDHRWLLCPSASYMGALTPNLCFTLTPAMLYSVSHLLSNWILALDILSPFEIHSAAKTNKTPCFFLPSTLYLHDCWYSISLFHNTDPFTLLIWFLSSPFPVNQFFLKSLAICHCEIQWVFFFSQFTWFYAFVIGDPTFFLEKYAVFWIMRTHLSLPLLTFGLLCHHMELYIYSSRLHTYREVLNSK